MTAASIPMTPDITRRVAFTDSHLDETAAFLVLGYNYKFSGKPGEAIATFRRVLEIEPSHDAATLFLEALENPPEAPPTPAAPESPEAEKKKYDYYLKDPERYPLTAEEKLGLELFEREGRRRVLRDSAAPVLEGDRILGIVTYDQLVLRGLAEQP